MSDLIDRQVAIDAVEREKIAHGRYTTSSYVGYEFAEDVLRKLPPANTSEFPNNSDTISRAKAIDICRAPHMRNADCSDFEMAIMMLPPAQPAQLEQCPIYGGMCCYPSDQCYDCHRHAGAKMGREVTE